LDPGGATGIELLRPSRRNLFGVRSERRVGYDFRASGCAGKLQASMAKLVRNFLYNYLEINHRALRSLFKDLYPAAHLFHVKQTKTNELQKNSVQKYGGSHIDFHFLIINLHVVRARQYEYLAPGSTRS
jgi:hypothetical protein